MSFRYIPFRSSVGQTDFRTMIGSCVWTAGLAMMGNPLVVIVGAENIEVNEA